MAISIYRKMGVASKIKNICRHVETTPSTALFIVPEAYHHHHHHQPHHGHLHQCNPHHHHRVPRLSLCALSLKMCSWRDLFGGAVLLPQPLGSAPQYPVISVISLLPHLLTTYPKLYSNITIASKTPFATLVATFTS